MKGSLDVGEDGKVGANRSLLKPADRAWAHAADSRELQLGYTPGSAYLSKVPRKNNLDNGYRARRHSWRIAEERGQGQGTGESPFIFPFLVLCPGFCCRENRREDGFHCGSSVFQAL